MNEYLFMIHPLLLHLQCQIIPVGILRTILTGMNISLADQSKTTISSLRRSPSNGPRYTQPQPANHGSDSSTGMSHYGVDQYSELDDGSINRYKTNHYYDIYEYKPYVDPSGYSKTQFSSSVSALMSVVHCVVILKFQNDSYRQQHTSYSQVANGYSQDYAVLSPVNEV